MSTNLLDQARQLDGVRRREATAAYRSLIRDLAAASAVLPELILSTADGAGRTLDDVDADVAKLKERHKLAAQAEQLESHSEASRLANERITVLEAERDRVLADVNQRLYAAGDERDAADRAARDAREARAKLIAKCDYPELLARREDLQGRRTQLADLERHLRKRLNPQETGTPASYSHYLENKADRAETNGYRSAHAARAEADAYRDGTLAAEKAKMAEVREQLAALAREEAELTAEMAKP